MDRPENYDIWDGIELKRNENLTDEQREKLVEEALKKSKKFAEERKYKTFENK